MPEADGYVRISTKLDDAALTRQMANLGAKLNKQLSSLEKAKQNVQDLERAFEKLASGEATPKSVSALEKEIERSEKNVDSLNKQLDSLTAERQKLREMNIGGIHDSEIADLNERIEALSARFVEAVNHVEELKAKLAELKADPTKTAEAEEIAKQLELARSEVERLSADAANTKASMDALRGSTEGVQTEVKKSAGAFEQFGNYVKRLAKRMLVLYMFRRVFTYIRNAIMSLSGLSVVTGVFSEFNNKMKEAYQNNEAIQGALAKLRGALYNAFAPIYSVVAPSLASLINWLARAITYITAFFAALSGKKLSDSAEGAKDLAKSVGGVGGAAKEANKQLAQFDRLNTLSEQSGGGGGGGGGGSGNADFDIEVDESKLSLFERVGRRIAEIVQNIKDRFKEFSDWWQKAEPGQKAIVLAVALGILIPLLFVLLDWPAAMVATLIVLMAVVEKYYDQITGWLESAREKVIEFFEGATASIDEHIKKAQDWLTSHLGFIGGFLAGVLSVVGGVLNTVYIVISTVILTIIDLVNAVVQTIHAIASGDWKTAWEAWKTVFEDIWEGIKDIVRNVVNVILGVVESFINGIIGGINILLGGLNAVGNILGLGWTIAIPTVSLPRLAGGGFPDIGSLFIAGEAGPELVGSFGGHNNSVVNEAQLVQAFRQASSEQVALMQQQNALLAAILNKSGEVTFKPSSAAGRVFQQSLNMYNKAMG